MTAGIFSQPPAADPVLLVVHGGAGAGDAAKLPADRRRQYEEALSAALRAGRQALDAPDGSSVDAVTAAIAVLEDSPLFNAGKGAVFNREGRHELNAAVMDGRTRKAGAVAGVERIKNPIRATRAVMDHSPHVMLIGAGAERFARSRNLDMVSPLYFWTPSAWASLQAAETAEKTARDPASSRVELPPLHFGTVGAVARDAQGNLAAGTSTGGLTYVMPGRVGDSPLIGAGTYAENAVCAVSCTGIGELFIRHTVAADVAARVKYRRDPLRKAVADALAALPRGEGGVGGIIALDRDGNAALEFDTAGMFRGTITASGKVSVAIGR